jgi:hypothetical protein
MEGADACWLGVGASAEPQPCAQHRCRQPASPHHVLLVAILMVSVSAVSATVWSGGSSLQRRALPMTQYRITYSDKRADEVVEAESVTVEGSNGLVVLRKTVTVAGQPREVVVRRIPGAVVQAVTEMSGY